MHHRRGSHVWAKRKFGGGNVIGTLLWRVRWRREETEEEKLEIGNEVTSVFCIPEEAVPDQIVCTDEWYVNSPSTPQQGEACGAQVWGLLLLTPHLENESSKWTCFRRTVWRRNVSQLLSVSSWPPMTSIYRRNQEWFHLHAETKKNTFWIWTLALALEIP